MKLPFTYEYYQKAAEIQREINDLADQDRTERQNLRIADLQLRLIRAKEYRKRNKDIRTRKLEVIKKLIEIETTHLNEDPVVAPMVW